MDPTLGGFRRCASEKPVPILKVWTSNVDASEGSKYAKRVSAYLAASHFTLDRTHNARVLPGAFVDLDYLRLGVVERLSGPRSAQLLRQVNRSKSP